MTIAIATPVLVFLEYFLTSVGQKHISTSYTVREQLVVQLVKIKFDLFNN